MVLLSLFRRLMGRERSTLPPFDFARNRFPTRKKWPPNLRELTERQQFRFERKFKRRIRNKAIRPKWNKWVGIVQWSGVTFMIVWGVLFHDFRKDPMNPQPGEQPFKELRAKMWGVLGNFYTHTEEDDFTDTRSRARTEELARRERVWREEEPK